MKFTNIEILKGLILIIFDRYYDSKSEFYRVFSFVFLVDRSLSLFTSRCPVVASYRVTKNSVCDCYAAMFHVGAWKHFHAQQPNILFTWSRELSLCFSYLVHVTACVTLKSQYMHAKNCCLQVCVNTFLCLRNSRTPNFLSPCIQFPFYLNVFHPNTTFAENFAKLRKAIYRDNEIEQDKMPRDNEIFSR